MEQATPSPAPTSTILAFYMLLITPALSSCAINNFGTTATKITKGDGAIVYENFTPGLHIRPLPNDLGLSLGYTERTCITENSKETPTTGWHYFYTPFPKSCIATDTSTIGIELRLGSPDYSITIGGKFTTQIINSKKLINARTLLIFDSAIPAKTVLLIKRTGTGQ